MTGVRTRDITGDLRHVLDGAVPGVCSAAVALIAVDGEIVAAEARGELVRYADGMGNLVARRPPATRDSIFDIASITKLFTTVVVLSLVEEGRLGLDEPITTWLPGAGRTLMGRAPGTGTAPPPTLRQLLTHTAGLPAGRKAHRWLPGDRPGIHAERLAFLLTTPLLRPPGERHLYSDVGLIIAGRLAELAAGTSLRDLVRTRVAAPLGLRDTGYLPPPALRHRIAATEHKPERPGPGCVRGEVHDETAYGLGGVAGHAGIFSTADDLLRFAEALRTGGPPLLRPASVAEMTRDHHVPAEAPAGATTAAAEAAAGPAYAQGLGVRIGDPAIAAPLLGGPGPRPYGHSGFTGTSLLVDPARALTVVLLTNNVHPRRDRPGIRALRHAVASVALQAHRRAAGTGGVADSSG